VTEPVEPSEPVDPSGVADSPDDERGFAGRAEARADSVARRFDKSDWIELVSALLLALATISAAWCAYQATRWSGVQANAYATAGASRQESVRASSRFNALVNIDVTVSLAFVEARRAGDADLAAFWDARFRPEFVPAFEAWRDTVPAGEIPDGTPFARPEYAPADEARAIELEAAAEEASATARDANQTGDNFVLLAVLFASVLFFAGVGTKFNGYRVRVVMISLASLMFVISLVFVFSLPQNVGL
jgi:hypothetical protein